MQNQDITEVTLESATALLLVVLAYKLYRLRCHSESRCCGDALHVDAENPGSPSQV